MEDSLFHRYGHGSCLLFDGVIIVIGGFGEVSVGGIAPHSRLTDVLKLQPDTKGWMAYCLKPQGSAPGMFNFLY